jgi:hypothetical protein
MLVVTVMRNGRMEEEGARRQTGQTSHQPING